MPYFKTPSPERASGLTLVELITVLAIIAVLLPLAAPHFLAWIDQHKLRTSAGGILTALQYARLRAVREHATVVLTFDPDGDNQLDGRYQVFVNQGIDKSTWWTREPGERIVLDKRLPEGVTVVDASFAGGIPRTRFNRRGFPNGFGGHVYLKNRRESYLGVHLNLNGNPRLVRSETGAKGTWK